MASFDARSDNELLKAIATQADKALQAQLDTFTFSGTANQPATTLTHELLQKSMEIFAQLPHVSTWDEIAKEVGLNLERGDVLLLPRSLEDRMVSDYDMPPVWLTFLDNLPEEHGYILRGDVLESFGIHIDWEG